MNFEEVYTTYVDTIFNYLRQRLKDSYLIEDILQDTFFAVYQNLNTVKNEISLKSWIISIAHNKMVDKLRKEGKETFPIASESVALALIEEFPARKVIFNEVLAKLNGEDRQIIYGLYTLQLTCKELAEIMKIPEGTVKSKAYYARKKLKKLLKEGKECL